MLLAQRLLISFDHSLRQLQRLLPSTGLAIHEGKAIGHPLTVFAYILEVEYPIAPTAKARIHMQH